MVSSGQLTVRMRGSLPLCGTSLISLLSCKFRKLCIQFGDILIMLSLKEVACHRIPKSMTFGKLTNLPLGSSINVTVWVEGDSLWVDETWLLVDEDDIAM